MALLVKQGSFAVSATPGNQAITGVGFQPKVVLFFGNKQTADGANNANPNNNMPVTLLGVGTPTAQCCVADNDDYTGGDEYVDPHCFALNTGAGAARVTLSFVSCDADGFTVLPTLSNGDAGGEIVNYVALGGSDLSNVALISKTLPAGTGNLSMTGAGFQPDGVILLGGIVLGGGNTTAGIGYATSPTSRASFASSYNPSPGGVKRYQRTDKAFVAFAWEADLVSMDADGLTLNFTTAFNGGTTQTLYALCLKGPKMKVGSFNTKTSTGTQAVTGLGFLPGMVLFGSTLKTSGTTSDSGKLANTTGATSGASQATVGMADNSGALAWEDRAAVVKDYADVGGGAATLSMAAGISTLDADGFTLNYTAADATAREILFMAFGDPQTGPNGTPILDNFQRTTLGSRWTGPQIDSNTLPSPDGQALPGLNGTWGDAYYNALPSLAGQDVEAWAVVKTVNPGGGTNETVMLYFLDASKNGYAVEFDTTGFHFYKVTAGSEASIGSVSSYSGQGVANLANGDVVAMKYEQATHTIRAVKNGVAFASVTDSTYTGMSRIGLEVGNRTQLQIESFGGGAIGTTYTLLDDATRADAEPITGSWANFPRINTIDIRIVSNQFGGPSSGSSGADYWTGRTFPADAEFVIDITALPINTAERIEMLARVQNPSLATATGYRLRIAKNVSTYDWTLFYANSDGSNTTLATVAGAGLAVGDSVRLTTQGNIITAYRNNSAVLNHDITSDAVKTTVGGSFVLAFNGTAWRADSLMWRDLTVTGGGVITAAAALVGQGAATVAGFAKRLAAAALIGLGTSSTSGFAKRFGISALTGLGSATISGVRKTFDSAGLTGAGASSTSGVRMTFASTGLTGLGSSAVSGTITRLGAAALNGLGSLAAAAMRTTLGQAALSGVGTLVANWEQVVTAVAALTGLGSLSASSFKTTLGTANLSGLGSSAIAGIRKTFSTTSLSGAGSALISGVRKTFGSGALFGVGTLGASGIRKVLAVTHLSGLGAATATAIRSRFGTASLSGTGALNAAGLRKIFGSVGLTGTGSLTVRGGLLWSAIANLVGSGFASASGTVTRVLGDDVATAVGRAVVSAHEHFSHSAPFKYVWAIREKFGAVAMSGAGSLAVQTAPETLINDEATVTSQAVISGHEHYTKHV